MKGKEHMIVGTTATATMGISLLMTNSLDNILFLVPLVFGGFIGSYMPDIDSKNSKIAQIFNKIIVILMLSLIIGYNMGLALSVNNILHYLIQNTESHFPMMLFCVLTILGKFSPHRMFTHKWFGTVLFCHSVYLMGNTYLTIGFIMGYILHILCDRFSSNGKSLKFFQFKLPCKNSKNKTTIAW